jgi:two-component sensor histidine kinase
MLFIWGYVRSAGSGLLLSLADMNANPVFFFFSLLLLSAKLIGQSPQMDSLNLALKNAKHDTSRVHCLVGISNEIYTFYPDSVIPLCDRAIALINKNIPQASEKEKRSYLAAKALAFSNIAFIQVNKGNKESAIHFWEQSLKIREGLNDQKGIASLLNNIGYVYNDNGSAAKALDFYIRSLKIREAIQDKKGITNSLHNIASIYLSNGDHAKAMEHYRKNLSIQKEINDKKGMAYSYLNIGNLLFKKGDKGSELPDTVKALDCFQKSLELFEEVPYKQGIAKALNNIGILYQLAGIPGCSGSKEECAKKSQLAAVENFQKSLKISVEISNKEGIASALNYIADSYYRQNKLKEATLYANRGMAISRELGSPLLIKTAANLLVTLYEKQQEPGPALEMYKLYIRMRDSITNTENQKALIHSEFQNEFDKKAVADSLKLAKDKEVYTLQIGNDKKQKMYLYVLIFLSLIFVFFIYNRFRLSTRQKKEIELQNKIILRSLGEKEILLKEIHHRVKNNLQVISSLLGLQSESIEDSALKSLFSESKNKINTISLIHQKLYQSNNLAEIDMQDYFSSLYNYIVPLFGNSQRDIRFHLTTSDIKFDVDTSVPLGLIFNELITNSLKYAFVNSTTGTITVVLAKLNDGIYSFSVQDNGQGFSERVKRPQALGLNLVGMLVTQLNGEYAVDSQNGTKITISFEDTFTRKQAE